VVVARTTVLLFALLGIYFQFRLVEYLESTKTAVIASVLYACFPLTLLFEKVVMLEIPALSLCIGALYYWIRYLRGEKKSDIYWFAFLACAALLTKQTAAFLLPVCILSVLLTKRVHLFTQKTTWIVVAVCAVVLSPYYLAMAHFHGTALAQSVGAPHPLSLFARATFYWRALPSQITGVVLALAVLGLVTYCVRREWEKLAFFLAWILGCYLTLTPIGILEPRFMIYWLPAWAWLAAVPFTVSLQGKFLRTLQPIAAVLLLSAQLLWTLSFQRPYVAGYAPAARSLVTMAKSGYVLFDGPLPGNFVFFVRASDPSRRIGVLRKALYVTMISKEDGSEELVHGANGIRELLADDAVRYIVVAENAPTGFPVQRTLRDLLHSDHQFQLRAAFPVTGTDRVQPGAFLAIYENTQAPASPAATHLHVKMLTTRHDLNVPFATLGPPPYSWNPSDN
jgi:Dolichyl-phosphate-mannose-protein mannosyltransferase